MPEKSYLALFFIDCLPQTERASESKTLNFGTAREKFSPQLQKPFILPNLINFVQIYQNWTAFSLQKWINCSIRMPPLPESSKNSHHDEFLCGVVEGFYGRPWTTEQRKDLFTKLQVHIAKYWLCVSMEFLEFPSQKLDAIFRVCLKNEKYQSKGIE